MTTQKVKVKVKKKKLKIKNIIIMLIILSVVIISIIIFMKLPIKNIYISGNEYVTDKEIIASANIENYPAFIKTYFNDMETKILKNKYIKNVNIKRTLSRKVYINVEENYPIASQNNKIILSSGEIVEKNKKLNISYVPEIINDITPIYDDFIKEFSKVSPEVLLKISQIEYVPNSSDKKILLLYMVDYNYVYITLSNVLGTAKEKYNSIDDLNKYNSIVSELDKNKGIIHLEYGHYVEIKK